MLTITTYLHNKNKRINTAFIIEKGEGYYFENGGKISVGDFNKKYPIEGNIIPLEKTLRPKGANPDKTRIV